MALSATEIQTVKNYMGYGSMTQLALPYLEWAPIFEQVVQNNLNDFGEDYIRNTILPAIAQIEGTFTTTGSVGQLFGIKELVGDIVFDTTRGRTQFDMFQELRNWWIGRLADTIRIPVARPMMNGCCEVY